MTERLSAAYLKVRRANEHLNFLNGEISRFLGDENRRVVGEFKADTRQYIFRVSGGPPPMWWGVIVGEFAHNLRSALDYIVWQLILLRGNTPREGKTAFPIYDKPEWYARKALDEIRGVSQDDETLIESLQPYHLGTLPGPLPANFHPLALLRRLNNIDKHRYIHVGFALEPTRAPTPIEASVSGNPNARIVVNPVPIRDVEDITLTHIRSGVDYDDPTEVMRYDIIPSGPDPQMEMDGEPTLEVALGDSDIVPAIIPGYLADIGFAVNCILDTFRLVFASI